MNRRPTAFTIVFVALVLLSPPWLLPAQERVQAHAGYLLDLPPGWSVIERDDPTLHAYSGPNRQAVLQVVRYPAETFESARAISAHLLERLDGTGEASRFEYNSFDATLADIRFSPGGVAARGYLLSMRTRAADFALLSYAPIAAYARAHDQLLSALESFSPDLRSRRLPGPVSQFYHEVPGANPEACRIPIGPDTLRLAVDPGEVDANQVLIEREARVLVNSRADLGIAWKRYYRAIYRDTYTRIARYADILRPSLVDEGDRRATAERILEWLQGFAYTRTGTLSDLQSPLASLCSRTGDCDSLGLLFASLLHSYGIDAILLVSERFGHSLVGVDVPGPGARFQLAGTSYVLAELTDQVPLGLIPQEMADPSGWRAIRLSGR